MINTPYKIQFQHPCGQLENTDEVLRYAHMWVPPYQKWSSQKLDWLSTLRVIRGVSHGVAYLHSKNVGHLNINPANIVFDSNMIPKITNFERSNLDKNVAEAMSHEIVGTV